MSACAGCTTRGGCGGVAFAPLSILVQKKEKTTRTEPHAPVKLRVYDGGSAPSARKTSIWILVADEKTARVFMKHRCSPDTFGEITPDTGGSKLAEISGWLDTAVHNDAFDRLVLIATPKASGHLRTLLSHAVQSRLIAEVSKDLMALPEEALQQELKKIVWF